MTTQTEQWKRLDSVAMKAISIAEGISERSGIFGATHAKAHPYKKTIQIWTSSTSEIMQDEELLAFLDANPTYILDVKVIGNCTTDSIELNEAIQLAYAYASVYGEERTKLRLYVEGDYSRTARRLELNQVCNFKPAPETMEESKLYPNSLKREVFSLYGFKVDRTYTSHLERILPLEFFKNRIIGDYISCFLSGPREAEVYFDISDMPDEDFEKFLEESKPIFLQSWSREDVLVYAAYASRYPCAFFLSKDAFGIRFEIEHNSMSEHERNALFARLGIVQRNSCCEFLNISNTLKIMREDLITTR